MPPTITLTSPLPPADLLFQSMNYTTGLSMLGEMQLNLLSPKANLQADDLLGQPVTVTVELRDEAKRHFNGHVTRFGMSHREGRLYLYHATVRPWLWFLTRTTDCRIFQDLSVPEIVKKVFDDHSVAHFEFKPFRQYRKRVYCVQYRESDFNFVTRLLEEEGLYWHFEHSDNKHKLLLVDSQSVHTAAAGCEELPFYADAAEVPPDTEYVSNCTFSQEVRTGKVVLTSYDFERPSTKLEVEKMLERSYKLSDYEQFDYQGDYVVSADGEQLAEDELDETQTRFARLRGASNAHGLETGRLFMLREHPREEQNVEYLVTATTIHAHVNSYESGGSGGGGDFQCDFQAIPSKQQFRPARRTPKPFVQGPQSAIVTGPSGDEIFTDKYGRVKVQFHWDRYGQKNESSSCWMRVSHPWAGKGWGAVSIPRIGQEVIVDFLEGDPDQPIVTGRVYNAENMPPFALPGAAATSGMKSKSHKATGFNEMSADDTGGKEKINIHGQYDMTTTVQHDQTNTIKNNRSTTVVVDDVLNVDANRTVHVKGKLGETIDTGQEVTVSAGYKETITGGATSTITGGLTSTVNGTWDSTVNGHLKEVVSAGDEQEVTGGKKLTVSGGLTEDITGEHKTTVTGAIDQSATATLKAHATGAGTYTSEASLKLAVAGSVVEITPAAITISASGSTIKIDAAGVAINGAKISLN